MPPPPTPNTDIGIGVDKLGASVARQSVDDDNLTPLLHIHQQVAQLAVVLVNQVNALWANLFKRLDGTPSDKLREEQAKVKVTKTKKENKQK